MQSFITIHSKYFEKIDDNKGIQYENTGYHFPVSTLDKCIISFRRNFSSVDNYLLVIILFCVRRSAFQFEVAFGSY